MQRAFTLIELLVVIAIVGILAAILFPVFARAKLAAKKTQSLSNVKNIVLGVGLYLPDADDVYPQSESGGGNSGTPQEQWYLLVHPYVRSGVSNEESESRPVHLGRSGLWDDPAYPKKIVGQAYGINGDIAQGNYGQVPGTSDFRQVIPASAIDRPVSKVLVMNKNVNGGTWNYPQLGAEQWRWTSFSFPENKVPTRDTSEIASGTVPAYHGGFMNRDSSWADCGNWNVAECELGLGPAFRYGGVALAGWADGHASSVLRNQLRWYENIAVPGPNWPWTHPSYPY